MDDTKETALQVARRMAEYATEYDANSVQNQAHIHAAIAQAFALIAQAEAAERQAAAMEKIMDMLQRSASDPGFGRLFFGVETLDKSF